MNEEEVERLYPEVEEVMVTVPPPVLDWKVQVMAVAEGVALTKQDSCVLCPVTTE